MAQPVACDLDHVAVLSIIQEHAENQQPALPNQGHVEDQKRNEVALPIQGHAEDQNRNEEVQKRAYAVWRSSRAIGVSRWVTFPSDPSDDITRGGFVIQYWYLYE